MTAHRSIALACALLALGAAEAQAQDAGVRPAGTPADGGRVERWLVPRPDAGVRSSAPEAAPEPGSAQGGAAPAVPGQESSAELAARSASRRGEAPRALPPAGPSQEEEVPAPPGQLLQSLPDDADAGELDGGGVFELPDAAAPLDAGVPFEADAGPADAGRIVAAEPEEEPPERDILDALSEWMWERAERESVEREAARLLPPSPEPEHRVPEDLRVVIDESVRDWIGIALPDRRMSTLGLLVLLAFAALLLFLLSHLRRPLRARGLLPNVLGATHLAVRLATLVMLLMLLSRLLPAWLQPSLLLTIAAVAVAVGFGAVWALLPDVVGGIVLLTEGRVQPGQWIMGEGFAGTVERVGPRVTLLRGADGALLMIPNRRMLKSPVHAVERPWHEVEVELRAPSGVGAVELRRAIRDAVLSSPYIPPDPALTLSRDPREPDRWRLRVRLLNVRFTNLFEGELLERVEEAIARSTEPPPAAERK